MSMKSLEAELVSRKSSFFFNVEGDDQLLRMRIPHGTTQTIYPENVSNLSKDQVFEISF